jgi:16S rRNA (guanine966-N2)-methyltransferase
MRVVGGEWKGRPLAAPAGRFTRPTSDKVREAMFGILAALPEARLAGAAARDGEAAAGSAGSLTGHIVLDLFAGSGALGIEALSRGARSCAFVESDRGALGAVRQNLDRLGLAGSPQARVVATDVRRALQADARRGARYTLVLADPPYAQYDAVRPALLRLLPPVLAPRAVLVVETAVGTAAALPWTVLREKRYGDTLVTVLVAGDGDEGEGVVVHDEAPSE